MSVSEIVTLQIGHYSNFVGSHWWNCQESSFVYDPKIAAKFPKEINHDVLYREGRTLKGEVTYTPRLIVFDLSNSLGSVKREGILYDVSAEDDVRWQGDVTLHQQRMEERNPFLRDLENQEQDCVETNGNTDKMINDDEGIISPALTDQGMKEIEPKIGHGQTDDASPQYYNLDDDVKVWSDYLRTSLHAKTVHIIKEHQHNNPEQPFDVFGVGSQVLSTRESQDAMEDRVRFFTEECDQLQGFHILLDSHNAFGGFASPILTYLEEEYSSKSRLSISLTPACTLDQTARERSCRILNSALSLQSCIQHNSLHIPLSLASSLWKTLGSPISLPHLHYKANLDYHTSAILATALDTFTLPYRKQDDSFKIFDITAAFNNCGRKVASLHTSLPLPIFCHNTFADYLLSLESREPWMSLTPHIQCASSPQLQSCVVRGLPSLSTNGPVASVRGRSHSHSTSPSNHPLSLCSSNDDVLRLYLTETFPQSASAGCVIRDPLRLDTSFPHIFDSNVSQGGFISDINRPLFHGVESVPVMTSLQSGRDLHEYVNSLSRSVGKLNISKHQHFLEAGLDPDAFQEMLQDLEELGHCYE